MVRFSKSEDFEIYKSSFYYHCSTCNSLRDTLFMQAYVGQFVREQL